MILLTKIKMRCSTLDKACLNRCIVFIVEINPGKGRLSLKRTMICSAVNRVREAKLAIICMQT